MYVCIELTVNERGKHRARLSEYANGRVMTWPDDQLDQAEDWASTRAGRSDVVDARAAFVPGTPGL